MIYRIKKNQQYSYIRQHVYSESGGVVRTQDFVLTSSNYLFPVDFLSAYVFLHSQEIWQLLLFFRNGVLNGFFNWCESDPSKS